ncbi:hypothetical protein BD289DRAFT_485863 [Coniella lustricola]|uniref:GYF domain-containing protein n=1 Tax=Coniella lustricola TaxID=2025994 RepID=A0A2T2ZX54_9PEZI|nr:hypothetical protein BD289DRAFT_485863 [Coniella lustricola]
MPGPNLPSSFASAAAGQNSGRDRNSGRGDSRASSSSDWLRRDGRSNGTAILRRSSTTPFNNYSQSANPATAAIDSSYPPAVSESPVASAHSFPPTADSQAGKYCQEELLEVARAVAAGSQAVDVSSLLMEGFQPGGHVNGHSSRAWGKPTETSSHNDPTVCWNNDGSSIPLGLQDMSIDEKELFASDVNSPLKQQQQQQNQQNKDNTQPSILNGRKQSVSQGLASPSGVPRPATRRRETTDTNPFSPGAVISPTTAGPSRLDMSWLGRKGPDNKDDETAYDEKQQPVPDSATRPTGFAGLARSSTTGAGGFSSPAVWGAATTTPTTSAFNGFGHFALNSPGLTDKGFPSSTASSRFFSKKDSAENMGSGAGPGTENVPGNPANVPQSWRSRPRTDTDPFGGDETLSGSAALGGARDTSPPPMPTTHGSQIFDTPAKASASDFGMSGLNLGSRERNASASPSQTNPYRSPPAERGENDHDEVSFDKSHALGGPSEQNSNFGSIRGFPAAAAAAAFEGSDRSQTSSVGAKNYPALGNIGGWPSAFPTATPDRERAGFGSAFVNSVFSPLGSEIQSPGLGSMGGLFGPASSGLAGAGAMRGSSKLGSLFPPAMQAQMQTSEHDSLSDSLPDLRQSNPLSAIGQGAIGAQSRDTESPLPMGRGLADFFPPPQSQIHSPAIFSTAEHTQSLLSTAPQSQPFGAGQAPPFGAEPSASGPPQSQSRIMVMPDRMRWIYMDPQGQQQGPFTGLEMNEWYKGNFFTNDLRVRKLEDPEFEPLGQLIRRIGNSREPFLVPQVGIAHGPPAQSGPFAAGGDSRVVIPPLTGLVPSYGKTLTAEEQNNLERRKQEEQVAAARHREYMSQQSHFRNIHPGVPGGLQHQASVHSLQSQPSFGSITSPIGMPPQAPIGAAIGGGPTPGFFDQAAAVHKGPGLSTPLNAGTDHLRDVHEHDRQFLASLHGSGGVSGMFPPQPVGPPTTDLKSQLPNVDQLESDPQGFKERLKEFQEYQGVSIQQRTEEEVLPGPSQTGQAKGQADETVADDRSDAAVATPDDDESAYKQQQSGTKTTESPRQQQNSQQKQQQQQQSKQPQQVMSLTQQVQKTQAETAQAAQRKAQEEEAWARQSAATGLPMPFPAPLPPANAPLPAPTAQRRSNIADQYLETRSQSQSPDSATIDSASAAQPPPLAPWARDPGSDSQKGPSIKAIQEAEAQERAVKDEAKRRRLALEQEALAARERENVSVVTPGLPRNSTWGSGSPNPVASSPWTKPAAVKPGVAVVTSSSGTPTPGKKSMLDIQREEEARKLKEAKEQTPQAGVSQGASTMGKRYADLASKSGPPGIATAATAAAAVGAVAAAPTPALIGGWSTVGAGGKVKTPVGPPTRSASTSTVRAAAPQIVQQQVKPAASTVTKANSVADAQAALQKWFKGELLRGLRNPSKVDLVANNISEIGTLDKEIVELVLYEGLSFDSAVDPRHLAQEYIRRKKQAEQGVFEPVLIADPKAGGGWSEVAKKGGSSSQPKEADVVGAAGFKVVPRKKGKK